MKRLLILIGCIFLFNSCGVNFRYAALNHAATDPIYGDIITVPSLTKIDTIASMFDLRRKLRNDFRFRWDFAQYAMNQPYSWYWSNPRLDGIWRPYNRFDVYFHSHIFWHDWALGYPFRYNSWGWNSWNRPYSYYGWNRPYDPWHTNIWNSRDNNYSVAYINGRRGSNIANYNNRTIGNSIIRRYNNPRNNVNDENINRIVNEFKENGLNVRIINNSNNDQTIRTNPRGYGRPESSNNGGRSWNRQNVPPKPVVPRLSNPVQPRQVYRGSGSSVLQQTRSSVQSNSQGRNGSSRRQN